MKNEKLSDVSPTQVTGWHLFNTPHQVVHRKLCLQRCMQSDALISLPNKILHTGNKFKQFFDALPSQVVHQGLLSSTVYLHHISTICSTEVSCIKPVGLDMPHPVAGSIMSWEARGAIWYLKKIKHSEKSQQWFDTRMCSAFFLWYPRFFALTFQHAAIILQFPMFHKNNNLILKRSATQRIFQVFSVSVIPITNILLCHEHTNFVPKTGGGGGGRGSEKGNHRTDWAESTTWLKQNWHWWRQRWKQVPSYLAHKASLLSPDYLSFKCR